MRNISIIQTPVRFYPYIGGVENHVFYLSKELSKKNYKVTVICANEPDSKITHYNKIIIKRLKYFFKIANTNITPTLPLHLLFLDFDIIHTHIPTPWSADWSILIAKLRNKKSIITIHCDLQKTGFFSKLVTDIYLMTLFKLTLSLVNIIIIVNPNWENTFTYTKDILAKYKNKISYIPNGVDTTIFHSDIEKETQTLLFVSILDKHHRCKGLEYLLQAMKIVKEIFPKVRLEIIGDGELKNHYIRQTNILGISSNVEFLGKKTQEQIIKYYSKDTVFILPSTDTEAFGIVLLEAMSCRTPVITTDIIGPRDDIKKYKAGLIIKPRSTKLIAKAIIYLLKHPKTSIKMGENGEKLVKNKYDWSVVTSKLLNVIKN